MENGQKSVKKADFEAFKGKIWMFATGMKG